ncbi:MAG: hypothetical protein JEZ06_13860 [Anaerolineaceae bacterium]|nr:hypothetical protein [Anaerolineaceae bacterium]
MMSKPVFYIIKLLMVSILLMACNLATLPKSLGLNQKKGQTQTMAILELTRAAATETPEPTRTSVPASPTPKPTQTNTMRPTQTPTASITPYFIFQEEIFFYQGGTSSFRQNKIRIGEEHRYSLWANDGQTLILTLSSASQDVNLLVPILSDIEDLGQENLLTRSWVEKISKTGAINFSVISPDTENEYFLTIEIPVDIEFQSGTGEKTIDGNIAVDEDFHPDVMTRVRYLLKANAGQTLTINLESPRQKYMTVGVTGQEDGQQYLAYHMENNGGELDILVSQGYYIDIYSTEGISTEYILQIGLESVIED